jgi:hypothetical protein
MKSVGSNGSQPTGMHDEGDGLLLCEWCSQDYDHILLVVFLETYIMVSFKVLLWSILCTLTDMGVFLFWGVFGDFLIMSMEISWIWSELFLFVALSWFCLLTAVKEHPCPLRLWTWQLLIHVWSVSSQILPAVTTWSGQCVSLCCLLMVISILRWIQLKLLEFLVCKRRGQWSFSGNL